MLCSVFTWIFYPPLVIFNIIQISFFFFQFGPADSNQLADEKAKGYSHTFQKRNMKMSKSIFNVFVSSKVTAGIKVL